MHGRKTSQNLAVRLMAFIDQWNETANPFNWTSKSVAKVTAKCQAEDSKPLPMAAWNLRPCLAVSRAKLTYYEVYALCTVTIRIVKLTDRRAKEFNFFRSSGRLGQRRLGPSEVSVEGGRRRGGTVHAALRGRGTPS